MAPAAYAEDPPSLSQNELAHILSTVKDWSIAHGLAVRPPTGFTSDSQDPEGVAAVPAPVTLFPSIFPRSCYQEAKDIQKAYNQLYARISVDEEWLGKIVQELVGVDDFIEQLWRIHLKVKQEGYIQPLSLGLFRSDYMVHVESPDTPPQIRQVEFNTISSSFGGLASKVSLLHKYLLNTHAYPSTKTIESATALPTNDATQSLARGLVAAHQNYGTSKSNPQLPLCVLFVVQESERNIFDQRHLEFAVQAASIAAFRLPFSVTLKHVHVSKDAHRALIFTPPHLPPAQYEVSVVYFRSTYTPADFTKEADWEARFQLERSAAIKCPSILTHLAGSKKVQQVLATPLSQHLSKFLDEKDIDRVRNSFAAIYPLDDSEAGRRAKAIAADPTKSQDYVLKPQREGGGNNVYKKAIPEFLKSLKDENLWKGYILMELIEPPSQKNMIFRGGLLQSGEVVAELGIFGTCLWNNISGDIIHNEDADYLLRTKGRESEEGGVAAGFGAIDSVCLVDV